MSFRIGLFGLEKLHNIERSVAQLEVALTKLGFTEKLAVAA
jgi:aspartate aminotransferase-like enzyme